MLAADKQALESSLKKSSLQIRERELNFFTSNFSALATQAALLAGFSYTGLQIDFPDLDARMMLLRALYYFISTMSMGLNLLTVCNATFCNMFGPGLALRGPDGSMHRAVDGMNYERNWTFKFFCAGMVSFHISGISLAWLKFQWPEATIVSLALLIFLYAFFHYGKRIHQRFEIPDQLLVTGQVNLGGFNPEIATASVCVGCRGALLPGQKFCMNCGTSAPGAAQEVSLTPVCPSCRNAVPPGSRWCGNCGTDILGAKPGAAPAGGPGVPVSAQSVYSTGEASSMREGSAYVRSREYGPSNPSGGASDSDGSFWPFRR
eukprot:tig00001128_g7171.t1